MATSFLLASISFSPSLIRFSLSSASLARASTVVATRCASLSLCRNAGLGEAEKVRYASKETTVWRNPAATVRV